MGAAPDAITVIPRAMRATSNATGVVPHAVSVVPDAMGATCDATGIVLDAIRVVRNATGAASNVAWGVRRGRKTGEIGMFLRVGGVIWAAQAESSLEIVHAAKSGG